MIKIDFKTTGQPLRVVANSWLFLENVHLLRVGIKSENIFATYDGVVNSLFPMLFRKNETMNTYKDHARNDDWS